MKTYVHISDLHFGAHGAAARVQQLEEYLQEAVPSEGDAPQHYTFILTGDAVDSPTKANIAKYQDFSAWLEETSGTTPLFVLGNHDVNPHGLAFWRNNQILAESAGNYPKIVKDDEAKAIFLLFDSNIGGLLAQGKIGREQMDTMAALLKKYKRLKSYTLVAVLHHHLVPVDESSSKNSTWWRRLIPDWLERLIPGLLEETVELRDAAEFIDFLKAHKVGYVLHGHKHLQFLKEYKGIHIIACGSSSARPYQGDPSKTCLSYNVLGFTKKELVCAQCADNLDGAGLHVVRSVCFPR
ncbi:MAG: metallophosphoesterase [Coriobacteriia bacterium]|nr:metallophosphoesterase [Coriobacteriia bacterium]